MKSSLIATGAVALLIVGAGGGWWWARHSPGQPVPGESRPEEALYWYDPMVPQQHFDKPGKSPFMDMQLVPKYAAGEQESSGVRIAPDVLHSLGVRLATVERVALSSRVDASGVLGFNERDVAIVQNRAAGFVQKVWPLAPGDRVKVGDPLAELLVPDWAAGEQEFLAIRSSSDTSLVDTARERLRVLGIDEAEIARLESSGDARSHFIVRAPLGGVVQTLELRKGMALAAGQTLMQINGLGTVWLEVAVPESQSDGVHVGDRVDVRLANSGASSIAGRVSALLPSLDDATRTLRVRVELANRDGALRPGQSAQVTLNTEADESALSVPMESVIRSGKRSVVMLAEEGSFRPVEVTLGREAGDRIEITGGLTEGQQVVASGQFLLDSEASMRGLGVPSMEGGQ